MEDKDILFYLLAAMLFCSLIAAIYNFIRYLQFLGTGKLFYVHSHASKLKVFLVFGVIFGLLMYLNYTDII